MFIEQIIEFELRGAVPTGRTYNPKNWLFLWQSKGLQGKFSSELLLTD